jgi:stress response protein YsnF
VVVNFKIKLKVKAMRQTVIGFFNSESEAERAVERLKSAGFSDSEIDISTRHTDSYNRGSSDEYPSADRSKDTPYNVSDESRYRESGTNDSHPDTLNEDRIRERRDSDDDDSVGDSIGRFFRNLFDNKEEAERYSSVGRKSSIVSVYTESGDKAEQVRDILDECGAVDVDDRAREFGASYDSKTSDAVGSSSSNRESDDDRRNALGVDGASERSIPVIEENVNIGKEEVQRGGVRLRSRIIERPVEENLRLREERVRVDRMPADRPATEQDFNAFREGEIEVTETAEVPVINKEARVVEEVRLTKDVEERDEVVRESVRKTDVDIENLADESTKAKRTRKK